VKGNKLIENYFKNKNSFKKKFQLLKRATKFLQSLKNRWVWIEKDICGRKNNEFVSIREDV